MCKYEISETQHSTYPYDARNINNNQLLHNLKESSQKYTQESGTVQLNRIKPEIHTHKSGTVQLNRIKPEIHTRISYYTTQLCNLIFCINHVYCIQHTMFQEMLLYMLQGLLHILCLAQMPLCIVLTDQLTISAIFSNP